MKRINKEEIKKYLIAFVVIITLLEVFWAYRVSVIYPGVYTVPVFTILFVQPILYSAVLDEDRKSRSKWGLTTLVIISIVVPITIKLTLPKYTYSDGRVMIQKELKEYGEIEFKELSKHQRYTQLNHGPKNILIKNKGYYYVVKIDGKERYFYVVPTRGNAVEISR